METIKILEEEQILAKNQMAFDLDNLPKEEEEETTLLPEQSFSPQDIEWIAKEVLFVVVNTNTNYNICGRPMLDWTAMAGAGLEGKIVQDSENILSTLKSIQTEKQYMIVFYSDTPLVSKNLLVKIMDYFSRNRLNALTLMRGYVFRVEFLKSIDSFILGCLESFDAKAFMRVNDGKSLQEATYILQNKILNFHEKNGVTIFDKDHVVIDADVEINEGTIIKGGNILKGASVIGKNVMLEEDNVISNSVIGDNCSLCACRVLDSKISDNKTIIGLDFVERKY